MSLAYHAYHCALCSAREGESYEPGDCEASEARLDARVAAAGWVGLPGDTPRRRWQLIICGDCAAELRGLLAVPGTVAP